MSEALERAFPLIIGHRGAAAVAPENTIASFKRAMEDGADGIEFDVRLASDNVAVVIHDASLSRTGLRQGLITSLSSTDLSAVDVGTWFNLRFPDRARDEYAEACVPTLAQVFELFQASDARLYVEMKCGPVEARAIASSIARLILDYALHESVVVESFTLAAIAELKRIAPEIRTAALFEPKWTRPAPSAQKLIAETLEARADEIALHHLLATRRTIAEAARQRINTVVWTVDNSSWLKRARDYGIHALITNDPARMKGNG